VSKGCFEKRFVRVNGLRLGYLEEGKGEPVVLVHGWPTYSYLWRQQVTAFAERFHVYALDLPGFGDSDKPEDFGYALADFVRVLDGFLAAVGVERASLVCHDLGGPIALLWALRNPERLARLVITDTMPYQDLPLMIRLMLPVARLPGLGRALVSRRGLRLMLQLGTVGKGVVTEELVTAYDRPYAGDVRARKTLLGILTRWDAGEMTEVGESLAQITAPTLILWAEKDPTAPLGIARRLEADIRGSTLVTVPDCGHFLTEDRPDEVNRRLFEFL
jgi:haloalkane dehalogenase